MRTLVIIPTYNERASLPVALERTRAAVPDADILVADDNSPDGTGAVAEAAAARDERIHVLHRPGKQGLGRAYVAGFRWALERGYDLVVEMDADGSHRPEQLPELLERARRPDAPALVIGSRWVPGGEVVNWPWHREVLSRGANTYVRLALGLPVRDATAGFRVFRADTLAALPLTEIQSQGYCFQVDMTLRVHRAGGRVVEVPISFVERAEGVSKMSRAIITEALVRVTGWALAHRTRRLVALLRARR
ncbi:polyprenol monophosphomannose synthase [uncultured Georgenia sp.]|uniref:polyprenol monophosphomannose synthase n=1 Tax=uncultured Georgenia sp. TaxID=378209 RepID=UPI00261C574F|nr:polyprenol monophosphomannose synthase [uncultured Georgenia sp.]HLV05457.1 polyprenol monophosphomannose synthase [Actinomycetaceae bacterium]